MDDYSRYTKHPKGFILDCKINKEGQLLVWTPDTPKDNPQKLPATKENIEYYKQRMEDQYRMIIDNKDTIIEDKIQNSNLVKKIIISIIVTGLTLTGLAFAGVISTIAALISAGITVLAGIGSNFYFKGAKRKEFERKMRIYDTFLKNRLEYERAMSEDSNITSTLSETATKNIQRNKNLKKAGHYDEVLNVFFMDQTPPEDLEQIELRYEISEALTQPIAFVNPSKQSQPQCRIRKPR